MNGDYKSRVYTDRPAYADFDAPHKFEAIKSIIGRRLIEHPNAICSYSGGSDSDIMLNLLETVRAMFDLPPVKYVFFNTGLEMDATKRHVRETAAKYGIEIETVRPKKGIVQAIREYGVPFMSKIMSEGLGMVQRKNIPFSIYDEFQHATDKTAKRKELSARFPKSENAINFLCNCNTKGVPFEKTQLSIHSEKYLFDFIRENSIPFLVSSECCTWCKKKPARAIEQGFDMVITGERRSEGGSRSVYHTLGCFTETVNGTYRLRPLYYVTNADKEWYKSRYNLRYSDAYEVYGLTRTGCCGCPIASRAAEDLEKIRPFEPNLVKAAWNVFGESYRYRAAYNEYKARRRSEEKNGGQCSVFDAIKEG